MPEKIYKLQPNRTLQLRGFDSFAAATALHSATSNSFKVSGTFRDPADFAVLVLWDADNFYEHPSLKYLPDFDFSGLTLTFDVQYSDGAQPIDSPKYNWIDWATLDCVRADGSIAQVRLWDAAMLENGDFTPASGTFDIIAGPGGPQPYDRVTLWFENLAYDFIVPLAVSSVEYQFFAAGTGSVHSISVNGTAYSHTESAPAGESSADQANALVAAINGANGGAGDAFVTADIGSLPYTVKLTARQSAAGSPISVTGTDGNAAASLSLTSVELVAANLRDQINSTDWIKANPTHALMARAAGTSIAITAARYGTVNTSGTTVTWVSGTRFSGLKPGLPIRITGAEYTVASVDSPVQLTLTAAAGTTAGADYAAPRGGRDGNMISMYALAKTPTLTTAQTQVQFSGGNSAVTWRCTIDFSALGIDQLRQSWLTFAPSLANGALYSATEWEAAFTNWNLTGAEQKRTLQVAGPGSVRVEENSSWCVFNGAWVSETGFYSRYFAMGSSKKDDSVTVTYMCQFPHDLYVGTSLYVDRGQAGVRLDADAETILDCNLNTGAPVNTRRKVRTSVAAGQHSVTFTLKADKPFYFDFLEAVVASDVPDALPVRNDVSPALDFDTDHTFKLSPARIHWIYDKLGLAGPMNEYIGVFWWNQRVLVGAAIPQAVLTFDGQWAGGDAVFVTINGTTIGKSVFPADNSATIAAHFAAYINAVFVGAWAAAAGNVLTINARSTAAPYSLTTSAGVPAVSVSQNNAAGSTGTATLTTNPQPAQAGEWIIDPAQSPVLNRATRDWHADFYAQCAARGREVVSAGSMELVLPPPGFAALFPDANRTPVSTATGFGTLNSNHCALGGSKMLAYQKAFYKGIADLQATAGLTPYVQFGEFLWWFFSGPGGMAFYDDETLAAAQAALGRPLHVFAGPVDDPGVNGGADALFLRNRLRDHVQALASDLRASHPNVKIEVLFPYDVNYPKLLPPPNNVGGPLNHFINLPVEWQRKETSGLDRIKVEALSFGSGSSTSGYRNLNLSLEAISLMPDLGWPLDSLRYLVPVFGIATPWEKEVALAFGQGFQVVNLWAFDHVCLYNLEVREQQPTRRALMIGA